MEKIKKTDMLKVPVDQVLVEDGFNVREDYGDIEALAKQIAAQGQKQPIKAVRNGETVILTAGHRRLEAIKFANKHLGAKIDRVLTITERVDDKTRVFEMLIDGDGSKPLSNKEMLKGIKRLLDDGVKKKEIVAQLGMSMSQAQTYNLVKAAEAPAAVQKLLDEGVISVAAVNKLQRDTNSEEELVAAAEKAVEDAKGKGKNKATGGNTKKKVSSDVAKLEEAIKLSDPTKPKVAVLQAIVSKLKSGASPESIAKLLK